VAAIIEPQRRARRHGAWGWRPWERGRTDPPTSRRPWLLAKESWPGSACGRCCGRMRG